MLQDLKKAWTKHTRQDLPLYPDDGLYRLSEKVHGRLADELIRKRHVWKLLEEQDRVLRSYYAQREGFERGGQGTQGQTGLGREHVGHGVYV